MQPDYLFITAGVAACCLAGFLALRGFRRERRQNGLAGLLWACFGAGLMLQGFSPHLKVERNRFIVPAALLEGARQTPKDIVDRERRMHLLSAILTVGAGLGLAWTYRDNFRRPERPQSAEPMKGGQGRVRQEA